MHCVAYSEEARDEAAEGRAEKEGAGASNFRPLALALAKTDMWEGHAGQTQSTSIRMQNPFGFHYLSVTVLSGIPGYLVERDCYMRAARISDI